MLCCHTFSDAKKTDDSKHPSASSVQRKRKREVQEQTCDRTYKSRRTNKGSISAAKLDFEQFSDSLTNSHTKCRNRLSRTKRRQQQTAFCAVVTEPMQNESVHQDPWPSCLRREDVLWTDKYNPQQSSEVIGNSASVRQLHRWNVTAFIFGSLVVNPKICYFLIKNKILFFFYTKNTLLLSS